MSDVLVIDDDKAVRTALAQTLELAGLSTTVCGSFIEARDHISASFPGVVLSDVRMPGRDGFAVLDLVRRTDPELPVIMLTGEGDVPTAVRGITDGAFDFLEKPCAPSRLVSVIQAALGVRRARLEARARERAAARGDAAARLILGRSATAEALRATIRRLGSSSAWAMITGEPGTGTLRVAEAVHGMRAATGAFVTSPAEFASADQLARLLESAEGGTLVLEMAERMPRAAQIAAAEILRGHRGCRVMAAVTTERGQSGPPTQFLTPEFAGLFEANRIHVPPLRDRLEDIPELFDGFLRLACEQAGRPVPEVPVELMAELMTSDWLGNARALQSAAMRFALGLAESVAEDRIGLADRMAIIERKILEATLRAQHGNASESARILKLPRKTFYDKLKRHDLRPEDFR